MTQPPPADPLQTELQAAFEEASAIEDADILRALDEEFAELTQEISRINNLPRGRVRQDNIEALREHWRKRAASRDHLPPWRRRLDEALEGAIERMLIESRDKAIASGDASGGLNLQLDSDAMMRHGMPVFGALLEGLQQTLNEKLKGLGDTLTVAATHTTDAGAAAPTPTPAAKPSAAPAKPSEKPADGAAAPAPAAKPAMQVNINLQGLLGSIIKQVQDNAKQGANGKGPQPPKPSGPNDPKKKR
jgi:hypothetical protein